MLINTDKQPRKLNPRGRRLSTKERKDRLWLTKQFLEAMKPAPLLSVSEFCDANLLLPTSNAESGKYRTSRTPYMREPMDAMGPSSHYRKITFRAGTQVGKTQLILNCIDFYVVNMPSPMLFVFSNDGEGKKMVNTRIDPMVACNEQLRERISSPKRGSSGDTDKMKLFPGGFLSIASGESPASLRSLPCRIVYLDEVDAMPDNIGGEGDPIELADKRTSTFSGREKIFISSTPVNQNSKIIREYDATDQRRYFVPCPYCGHKQIIEWKRIHWDAEGTHVKEAWLECENPDCKKKIRNHDKTTMLERGEWRPTNKKKTDPTVIGYWINGLYAPVGWQSWEKCVTSFLVATESKDQDKLTAFYNGILAEPYEAASVRPDFQLLYELSKGSGYSRGEIPDDVLVLTSGADVQENRIEVELKGWCRNGRSRSIQYYIFLCPPGSTTKDLNNPVWDAYDRDILNGIFIREDGVRLQPAANAMDRGWNTKQVNAFWMRVNNDRFHLVRGSDILRSQISSVKEDKGGKDKDGRTNQYRGSAFKYFDVGSSVLKSEIYHYLQIREQLGSDGTFLMDTPFVMQFPNDYDDEFFRQLTAEEYKPPTGKSKHGIWQTIRERNEALDCNVYNLAMWYKLDLYRFTGREYDEVERKLAAQPKMLLEKNRQASKQRTGRLMSKGLVL